MPKPHPCRLAAGDINSWLDDDDDDDNNNVGRVGGASTGGGGHAEAHGRPANEDDMRRSGGGGQGGVGVTGLDAADEDQFLTPRDGCAPDSSHSEPFKPRRKLSFCKEFSQFGCCDAKDAKAIKATVDELVDPKCSACHAIIAQMKCSECHPEAGKFWLERFSSVRLCAGFCRSLFALCADIPLFRDARNDDGTSAAMFINGGDIDVDTFCEPHVAPGPNCFSGTVPSGWDEECKCPNHDCLPEDLPPPPGAASEDFATINLGTI
ncbi:uncharacterized protein AMSG_10865 [Thecamonas trahens ATCC 50062]|uniref:Folate receptor-like domain-containing protein n=1 Tax=Thecamonas trahens ATCC 50062 TaxID=461836 RepID=A0A0L0DUQ8_THETB|nr:hypothetical protein AMSG_10865 [Thecamonas trahens ATCC 50062]KNC55233.1 hypothetical protein AMSG_10865 [Thecamonas trahens ATCC 50062]|eukprot:XP_013753162.1 hypothetical protein AMSG_10865 [Thecamonas trahens ATCC 50062]